MAEYTQYYLAFLDLLGFKEIVKNRSCSEIVNIFEEIKKPIDPLELVYPKELPIFDKYDEYLPEELVRKGFAYGVLDLEGMLARIREWTGEAREQLTDNVK